MAENEQELRQGLNKIEITGVVKEHKLNSDKNENGKYINGSLVIKAGEFTELEIKVFVNEKNSKGKEKKAYTTLKSILDGDYKTMADGVGEEEATKVRIWSSKDEFTAQFREEMFKPENAAEVVTKITLDLGFANVTVDEKITPEDYKAVFDVEMYVAKIEEEMKDDEETGRVIVKGWCPVYGGLVIPLEVIAGIVTDEEGEFDFAEQIRDGVDEGSTIDIWGNIDFKTIIEKVKKGGSLGRAKVDEKITYVNELTATGANIVEDPELEFDGELIEAAISEREIKKEEKLNEEKKDNKNKKGSGLNKGGKSPKSSSGTGKGGSKNRKPSDDGDIPF